MRIVLILACLAITAPAEGQLPRNGSVVSSEPMLTSGRIAPLPFSRGTFVRLRLWGGQVVEGAYSTSTWDTIYVSTDTAVAITAVPTTEVESMEVNRGPADRRSLTFRGVGYGAVLGGALGAALGLMVPVKECPETECLMDFSDLERAGNTLGGGVAGAIVGGLIGGIIGHNQGKGWRTHPISRVAFTPTLESGRLMAVTASIRLTYSR